MTLWAFASRRRAAALVDRLSVPGLVALALALSTSDCSDEFVPSTQDLTIAPAVGWLDTMSVTDTATFSIRLAIDGRMNGVGLPVVDWNSTDENVVRVTQKTAGAGQTSWDTLSQKLEALVEAHGPGKARVRVSVQRGSQVFAFGSAITVMQRWTSVSASWVALYGSPPSHSCAISVLAIVFCWGETSGLLGNGLATSSLVPVTVPNLPGLESITAGGDFSCGTAFVGVGFCWGSNEFGQIGDGSQAARYLAIDIGRGILFTSLKAGSTSTCGTRADGGVYCWGLGNFGQLGIGSSLPYCDPGILMTAIQCETMATLIRVPRFYSGIQMREFCTGQSSSFSGCTFSVSGLSVGRNHACGIAPVGAAFCWGSNDHGQIGGPVLDNLCILSIGGPCSMTPAIVGAADTGWAQGATYAGFTGPKFTSVSAGWAHTCGIETNGQTYCWGAGTSGQLGNGLLVDAAAPVAVVNAPAFASVHAGGNFTCGLTVTGDVYCWGAGFTTTATKISGSLKFTMMSTGYDHSCGITQPNGAIYCWGNGNAGQLGTGTRTSSPTPVRVAEPAL